MDTVISPSGNFEWTVYEKGTATKLGLVTQSGPVFMLMAGKDTILTGLSLGPYRSKQEAMDAIAKKVGGTCAVGV